MNYFRGMPFLLMGVPVPVLETAAGWHLLVRHPNHASCYLFQESLRHSVVMKIWHVNLASMRTSL